jgi:hypothetical protein
MTVQIGNVLAHQAVHKPLPNPPQRGGNMGRGNNKLILTVQYTFYNVHSTKKKIK